MDIAKVRDFCLKLKGTTESFPFNDTTLVFKVMNKMFCLAALNQPHFINLKCDPEKAIDLRERYSYVKPGYHMNKQHWNSVYLSEVSKDKIVEKWIKDSYDLIVASLPKKERVELEEN